MNSRSMWLTLSLLLGLWVSPYAYYRCMAPEGVLDYVGWRVRRPSWFAGGSAEGVDFTFDAHSKGLGAAVLGESFVSDNLVSRLCESTGFDWAELLNNVSYPLARVDHLFTGRYVRFFDHWSRPIFGGSKTPRAERSFFDSLFKEE